jgi:hypothetical protein
VDTDTLSRKAEQKERELTQLRERRQAGLINYKNSLHHYNRDVQQYEKTRDDLRKRLADLKRAAALSPLGR